MQNVKVVSSTINRNGESVLIDDTVEITVINNSESDKLHYGVGEVASIPLLPLEERTHTAPLGTKYFGSLSVKSEEATCDLLVLQTILVNRETA